MLKRLSGQNTSIKVKCQICQAFFCGYFPEVSLSTFGLSCLPPRVQPRLVPFPHCNHKVGKNAITVPPLLPRRIFSILPDHREHGSRLGPLTQMELAMAGLYIEPTHRVNRSVTQSLAIETSRSPWSPTDGLIRGNLPAPQRTLTVFTNLACSPQGLDQVIPEQHYISSEETRQSPSS